MKEFMEYLDEILETAKYMEATDKEREEIMRILAKFSPMNKRATIAYLRRPQKDSTTKQKSAVLNNIVLNISKYWEESA